MRTHVVIAVMLLVVARPALAQGPFRQDVVVTAAATPVELGTVTRTLTVITRDEIARLPVQSLADVLRVTGLVDVRARGERGVQTDFAIRGAHFGQMLVLVDGVRLNDAQSGHHNGDIPVPLDLVERIEVLHGPGSSLFGADAFGGTINVITRRDAAPASAVVETGSFGLAAARGQAGVGRGGIQQLFAAAVDRSAGFMFERGYTTAGATSRTSFGSRGSLLVSYLWKDFGANGFYGNSPSHEWTNQTLVSGDRQLGTWRGWRLGSVASYRTHGDHFLWDVRRPGFAENRHRTHAVVGGVRGSRGIGDRGSVTTGFEGGADWIRSSNLGDHATQRVSAFGEWRHAVSSGAQLDASLRVDRYTEFGTAWSPAVGVGWWPSSVIRLRASTGRAFRVPTFTERFYSDPAHLARSEIGAETAWAAETGADLLLPGGWLVAGTVFGRMDQDVIDWLRPTTADRWRTHNIHDVDALGVELTARKTLAAGAAGGTRARLRRVGVDFVQAGYTALDVRAAAVTGLSKYVLDYAPHSVGLAASVALPAAVRIAPRLEYRRRTRSTGPDDYAVVDLRISRRFGLYDIRIDGMNLGDAEYQEVLGVAMPGRSVSVSLAIGR